MCFLAAGLKAARHPRGLAAAYVPFANSACATNMNQEW